MSVEVLATSVTSKDGRPLVLRSPRPTEAAACLAYVRALSHESFRNLNHGPEYFDAMPEEKEASFLASLAAHPKNFLVAAWDGDVVVGSASISQSNATLCAHVAELGIGVLAAHARRGIGRLLMERLVFVASANGVTHLTLRVRTFNAGAIALYESLGFFRVGTLVGVARLPEGLADEHIYQRIAPTPSE